MAKKHKIIATTGTSINKIYNKSINKNLNFNFYDIYEQKKNLRDTLYELINQDTVNEEIKSHIKEFIIRNSSECKSICTYIEEYILKDKTERTLDSIYLLTSDTNDGETAAHTIKKSLEFIIKEIYEYNSVEVIINRVKGLNPEEKEDFLNKGIRNLLNVLYDIKHENIKDDQYKYVLNITGGYRTSVPYLVYFASGFDLDIYYIYEWSDYGIILPKIPIVEWDRKYLDNLKEIKRDIEEDYIQGKDTARDYNMLEFIDMEKRQFSELGNILIEIIDKKIGSEVKREGLEKKDKKKRFKLFG